MERQVSGEGSDSAYSSENPKYGARWSTTTCDYVDKDWAGDHFAAATGVAGASGKNGMFIDAASMKERLRQNMCKPQYDVANFYHRTGIFRWLATHKLFEGATLSVIALNALWISIDTDHNQATVLLQATPLFQTMEQFFCCYFTFEWFVRYCAFKRKRNGCRDGWFVFDSGMVVMMVLETWVMTIVMLATGAGGSGGMGGNASILRLARLLRLSRMMRMARLLRAMPELMILIKGMVAAMRSVLFTLLLLTILTYVFGIMFTQLMVDTEIGELHFSTVPLSMHTLILDGTFLDNLGTVVKSLGEESLVYGFLFYVFVLVSALTIMNMLIGVLCEVVSAVASTEKEELTVAFVYEKLQQVMHSSGLDEDGDGEISYEEFVKIMEIPAACETLSEVGVDVMGLIDIADFIFEGDDDDEEPKKLTFQDFMEIVLQLRGSNGATVKDIVDLRKFIVNTSSRLESKLEKALDKQITQRASRISMTLGTTPQSPTGCGNDLVLPGSIEDCHDALRTASKSDLRPVALKDMPISPKSDPPTIRVSRASTSSFGETQASTPEQDPAMASTAPLQKLLKNGEAHLGKLIDGVSNNLKQLTVMEDMARQKKSMKDDLIRGVRRDSWTSDVDGSNLLSDVEENARFPSSLPSPDAVKSDTSRQKMEDLLVQLVRLRDAINAGLPAVMAAQQSLSIQNQATQDTLF